MTRRITLFIAVLFLCGTMQAQNYHWSYNYHDYESNFPFIGEVYINGEAVASSDFEIAAFVGDQVRATEILFEADPVTYPGRYYAWLGISYNNAGETVTFKLYDHATETEYDNCSTTVLTNANGYGETWDPVHVEFTVETPISYGPEYPWVVSGGFENYMYMETQLQINGVPVTNTNWEVGAFCGEECRGLGDADDWVVSPIINSNILEIVVGGVTGDVINFYLYDVTNQEVFPAICTVSLDWVDGDIGDMIDPFVLNFVTAQTFTKDIIGYTEGSNDRYYLLASPIGEVNPENVTNMLSNNYDLYYFDQTVSDSLEWINYKSEGGDYNLVSGKGYLYANSEDVTLTFTGFPYYGDGQVTLTKDPDAMFSGWNLVGNPFAQRAYITKPFYTVNEDGSEIIVGNGNSVEMMEGIFVIAEEDNEVLTFSTEEPETPASVLYLNVFRNRGNAIIDRAVVRFDKGSTLPKFVLNENSTQIYISQYDKDYAVVFAEDAMGEMPVNFKAETNGNYSLAFNAQEVDFSYLHLIDNVTGTDVDLLQNPSYNFEARTTDYASRFKLVFITGNAPEDNFTFFSNGSWIINNEGQATLQVIDITGRILSSEQISGNFVKSFTAAPGVYMFRLVNGNGVKVQKVVVK
jgi:hypothetical protein